MKENRAIRVVATTARLVTGAAVAVACVIGVIAAVPAPWPGVQQEPAQTAVTPVAGDTVLVCSGSFRALGRDTRAALQMSSAGDFDLTTDDVDADPESSELQTPELQGASGAPMFTSTADAATSPLLAASESISLADEDLSGLASAACRPPSTESWLIGGAVSTGTKDILVLSNPGQVTATLTITVYGEQQSTSTLVVPAQTQTAVPLASIAGGQQQPVVRVTAAGSPVRAVLQSSLVQTLDPAGIDLQDTAGAPQAKLVFAGVQVVAPATDTPSTVLRVLSTDGASEASVTVRATGDDAVVQQFTVPLAADIPVEVNLPDLEVGVYSVEVTSDGLLTGAIWQSSGVGAGTDFAWMTPAPELADEALIAVPEATSPRLHVVGAADEESTVTIRSTDGSVSREVTIPAGASELVPVPGDAAYQVTVSAPVRIGVALGDARSIAGWPVWPGAGEQDPITVYP
jgi:hypothetical protein